MSGEDLYALGDQTNLFSALSTYGTREEENYLTESFVYLLKLLRSRMPEEFLDFMNKLAGLLPTHKFFDINNISIQTQYYLSKTHGRVDIAVDGGEETLALIEVKHDSPLGYLQLERYHEYLEKRSEKNKALVLLTRSSDSILETTLDPSLFHHVTWYKVHKWLSAIKKPDPVSDHFIKDFLFFLEDKNMSMKKVSWEYIQGVSSLLNLRQLMEVAISESFPGHTTKRSQGWNWMGLYIDNHFFFGIRYAQPLIVVYENNLGYYSTSKITLDLEEKHFFCLSSEDQLKILVDFLIQAKTDVKKGRENAVAEKNNDPESSSE